MNLKEQMEQIYSNAPPDKIPWNIKEPPKELVELVEIGKVTPCRTVDLGCGVGNYAIWLSKQGFDVTGIDFSENAIELANELAKSEKVNCTFLVDDLISKDFHAKSKFEFAYDWELLHHIFPNERDRYITNIAKMLRKGGRYYSVCFSELDSDFGGLGKYRKTPMDTTLYFSSEKEIEQLLISQFEIMELTTTEIEGKYGPHMAVVAFSVKK